MGTNGKEPEIGQEQLAWLDSSLGLGDFFTSKGAEKVLRLLPSLSLEAYPKGKAVVEEGADGTDMYVLYKGKLRVGHRRLLFGLREVAQLAPGDFFGEMAFLVNAPRSATVVAMEPCEVFRWAASDMQKVLESNPGLSEKVESVARERIAKLAAG